MKVLVAALLGLFVTTNLMANDPRITVVCKDKQAYKLQEYLRGVHRDDTCQNVYGMYYEGANRLCKLNLRKCGVR